MEYRFDDFVLASDLPRLYLTGKSVARLMRRERVTIRELAARMGLTLKAIRHGRNNGVRGHGVADWVEAITGALPVNLRHAYIARLHGGEV